MSSIFGVNPPKEGPKSIQNKGHLGSRHIYIRMILHMYHTSIQQTSPAANNLKKNQSSNFSLKKNLNIPVPDIFK